nr:hypothetical protein [Tanacetum cinerariifolium]
MMSFLLDVVTSRYPTTNNQLRNSLNPRKQATVNDGRVTLQPVRGRQISFATGTTRTYTPRASGSISRKKGLLFVTTAKEKDTYPRIAESQATQTVITHNAVYQADDLDAYDSDCDEFNTAKVPLMANCLIMVQRFSLRNSSNPRQQATINDGRVTLQPVHGRQVSFATGTTRTYTSGASRSNSGKQRTAICYNCEGEGHMSKKCTKPKRKQDDSWFKDKVLLVQAQANSQILHEEELAFLVDLGIAKDPSTSSTPTIVEVPKEHPKVSMVNTSLIKLKHHLAGFDVVVKERTMAIAIT